MPVYFAQMGGPRGPVKIGYTKNVKSRIKLHQSTSIGPLNVIRLVDADRVTETRFHRAFKDNHIRGEWFRFSRKMLTMPPPPQEIAVYMTKDNPFANLLRRIEKYCEKHGMSESRFGREACKNSSAITRLRSGVFSSRSIPKLEAYLRDHK